MTGCYQRGYTQGSSFGPLLFNIFQIDMTNKIENCKLSMYADNHQIFVFRKSLQEVETKLKSDIENASKWYQDNLLTANKDKISSNGSQESKPNDRKIEVKVNEVEIEQACSMKLLGVSIDDALSFTQRIWHVCTKASQNVGVLCRLHSLIPTAAKLILYKIAILPHLA